MKDNWVFKECIISEDLREKILSAVSQLDVEVIGPGCRYKIPSVELYGNLYVVDGGQILKKEKI
jgi:hypothetical protein